MDPSPPGSVPRPRMERQLLAFWLVSLPVEQLLLSSPPPPWVQQLWSRLLLLLSLSPLPQLWELHHLLYHLRPVFLRAQLLLFFSGKKRKKNQQLILEHLSYLLLTLLFLP